MQNKEIEERINRVVGLFAVDGIILTEEDKHLLKIVITGERTHEDVIKELNAKYRLLAKG